jgi:hypothetical protein
MAERTSSNSRSGITVSGCRAISAKEKVVVGSWKQLLIAEVRQPNQTRFERRGVGRLSNKGDKDEKFRGVGKSVGEQIFRVVGTYLECLRWSRLSKCRHGRLCSSWHLEGEIAMLMCGQRNQPSTTVTPWSGMALALIGQPASLPRATCVLEVRST